MTDTTSPSMRDRYAGLIEGTLVADSLALGPHWMYQQEEIVERFGRVTELLAPPKDGYHPGKARGSQTHYGDQVLVLMQSLEASGGAFVSEDFARRWRDFWPTSTAYQDHATKDTLAHLAAGAALTQAGSDSTELGGAARMAPLLLALRAEELPVVIAAARAQTALTHNSAAALDAAEFIVRATREVLRGTSVQEALRLASEEKYQALPAQDYWQRALAVRDRSTSDAVEELGQSCPLEKALPACLAILLRHREDPEQALIENVMAGGDSAARGLMLGTILGAAHGLRALPARWREALQARDAVEHFLAAMKIEAE